MKLKIPHTLMFSYSNGDRIVFTQHMNIKYNFGHYFYYIVNRQGDVLYTNSSIAAPPDKKNLRYVQRLYRDWRKDK